MSGRPPNDALHAQLSKGEAPAQLRIDRLDDGLGPTALGRCRVLDIEAQRALTDFTMGGHARGVAWSLNPYVGCLHRCRYCYVPDTIHVERQRWGDYVIVKRNLAAILREEIQTLPRRTVYISTATDPYQSIEAEREITRSCVQVLAHRNWAVDILTRSPLVLRDMELFRRFRQVRIGLSVPTLDDRARRILEPSAPPVAARLEALRRLSHEGFETYANLSPAYPLTDGWTADGVAQAFRDAGGPVGQHVLLASRARLPCGHLGRTASDGMGGPGAVHRQSETPAGPPGGA